MVEPTAPGARDERFAGYVLERRLAVGGMSEVFVACPRDEPSTEALRARGIRQLVLKRLLPDLIEDDAIREAFAQEARLHQLARHPNVVEFYEFGTYAGEPFIALELVDGVDLSRVVRRARTESRPISVPLAVHIGRELCMALSYVHDMIDDAGQPLGVIHRDVTPSNILLSSAGEVKLGDFGIAHVTRSVASRASLQLKGKYGYLAPEQVSDDLPDQRADLFSVAVVLAELLIGEPLFPGAGQLAVLLAIRDARIDALRAKQSALPAGLFEVLERALQRDPSDRFATAAELGGALLPFTSDASSMALELAGWVAYTKDTASAARQLHGAVLESLALQGLRVSAAPNDEHEEDGPSTQRATLVEDRIDCRLRRGGSVSDIHLAKLIEMLATGQVKADAEVDFGDGFHRIDSVAMLARYLPPSTATTKRVSGPGVPDFVGALPESDIAEALSWIVCNQESGALFAEPASSQKPRTELYFKSGKLTLAVSSEPSMLLGERLVAKGLIDRTELELAVLVMHRYNGQIGDTLIGLGLIDPVDVFQAIRAQGRERVTALFGWSEGKFSFYRGVEPARVDFRLDLDVPGLLLFGLSSQAQSGRARRDTGTGDTVWRAVSPPPDWAKQVTWPASMMAVLRAFAGGATRDQALAGLAHGARPGAGFSPQDLESAMLACRLLGLLHPLEAA